MNTNIVNRDNYTYVQYRLQTDDDRDACFLRLRSKINETLCQNIYSDTYINCAVEQSDYILLRRVSNSAEKIVAFALVKILKSKKLDILLVCTIPNKERFGNMIAYDIYSFALYNKCKKIYTEPRTPELRATFIKYGFVHLRGIENFNEVLEKDVHVQLIQKVNKTRKSFRVRIHNSNNYRFEHNVDDIEFI